MRLEQSRLKAPWSAGPRAGLRAIPHPIAAVRTTLSGASAAGLPDARATAATAMGWLPDSKRQCNEKADRLRRTSVRNLLAGRNDRAPFQ